MSTALPATPDASRVDVLRQRRTYLDRWFFLMRMTVGLGVIGYLAVDMLAAQSRLPVSILLVTSYLLANGGVWLVVGTSFPRARWVFAALDLLTVVLLRLAFDFEALFDLNATMVGGLTLLVICYALYSDPQLSGTLAVLTLVVTVVIFIGDALVHTPPGTSLLERLLASRTHPVRALLLFSYLAATGVIAHRLAVHLYGGLHRQRTDHHRRTHAAQLSTAERTRHTDRLHRDRLKDSYFHRLQSAFQRPLTALRTTMPILNDEPDLAPDVATLIDIAAAAGERLDTVTREFSTLLDVLATDDDDLTYHNVRVSDLVETVQEQRAGRPLLLRGLEGLWTCADPRLVAIALSSLFQRADRMTPSDQPITVTAHLDVEDVVLTVQTVEHGMEPARLDELNTLLDDIDARMLFADATGFEVALARHALDRTGGSLVVLHEPEQGTTYECVLPGKRTEVAVVQPDALRRHLTPRPADSD